MLIPANKTFSLLSLFVLGLTSSDSFAGVCGDAMEAPRTRTQVTESINGTPIQVTRILTGQDGNSSANPGLPVREVFSDEPEIIIGVNSANRMQPYMIVGDQTVRTISSSTTSSTSLINIDGALYPVINETTYYRVGVVGGSILKPGFFFRLRGLSRAEIVALANRLHADPDVNAENSNWKGVVENLTEGLKRQAGIRTVCDGSCDTLARLIKGAAEGFQKSGTRIRVEAYLLDQTSLAKIYRSERRRSIAGKVATGTLVTCVGACGVGALELGYEALAAVMNWPSLLNWFFGT